MLVPDSERIPPTAGVYCVVLAADDADHDRVAGLNVPPEPSVIVTTSVADANGVYVIVDA